MIFEDRQDYEIFKARKITVKALFKMYGKGDDEFRIAGYAKMLMDIDIDVLNTACAYLIDTQKFLPALSEIKDAVRIIRDMQDPDNRMLTWPEACLEIRKALQRGRITKFSRQEIADTVNQFGWRNLCNSQESDWPIIQGQLRKIYEINCKRKLETEGNIAVLQRTGRELPASDVKEIGDGK